MCDDNLKAGLRKMTLTISSAAMFFAFALMLLRQTVAAIAKLMIFFIFSV